MLQLAMSSWPPLLLSDIQTFVRPERPLFHKLTKRSTAGMYIDKSDSKTVMRMKALLPSDSNPRDETRANHFGLYHDPLTHSHFHEDTYIKVNETLHFAAEPRMIGCQRRIV